MTGVFNNMQLSATISTEVQEIRSQRLPHTLPSVDTAALRWGRRSIVTFTHIRLSRFGFDRRSKTMGSLPRCGYRTPLCDQFDTSRSGVGARAILSSFPASCHLCQQSIAVDAASPRNEASRLGVGLIPCCPNGITPKRREASSNLAVGSTNAGSTPAGLVGGPQATHGSEVSTGMCIRHSFSSKP